MCLAYQGPIFQFWFFGITISLVVQNQNTLLEPCYLQYWLHNLRKHLSKNGKQKLRDTLIVQICWIVLKKQWWFSISSFRFQFTILSEVRNLVYVVHMQICELHEISPLKAHQDQCQYFSSSSSAEAVMEGRGFRSSISITSITTSHISLRRDVAKRSCCCCCRMNTHDG